LLFDLVFKEVLVLSGGLAETQVVGDAVGVVLAVVLGEAFGGGVFDGSLGWVSM
jgi:hypothetical protein